MILQKQLRALLEARVNEERDYARGGQRFVNELWENVLCIRTDDYGRPCFGPGRARPEEFSIRHLAEAIFPPQQFERFFNPFEGFDRKVLLENANALDPTAHLNVNLFSAATAGLLFSKILEAFQNPAFIGDQVVRVDPTRRNGDKHRGFGGIGDKSTDRPLGQQYPRAGFGERWVTTPQTREKALAIDVLQETVFFDDTGGVLDEANKTGYYLGYGREKAIARGVSGVINFDDYTGFVYKDTAYNPYQTASPWVNSQTNPLEEYRDIDESLSLFRRMTDPETGLEIAVLPDTIVCHPDNEIHVNRVLSSYEVRDTTNSGNTVMLSPNPAQGKKYKVLSSMIWANVWTASAANNGLALSDVNAKKRWYHLETGPQGGMVWKENWPLRTRQATPTEYVMMDRGIIASFFSDYRGTFAVIEARKQVANTH